MAQVTAMTFEDVDRDLPAKEVEGELHSTWVKALEYAQCRIGNVLVNPATVRPVDNVFCPTGEGGGVDATCSPAKSVEEHHKEAKALWKDWAKGLQPQHHAAIDAYQTGIYQGDGGSGGSGGVFEKVRKGEKLSIDEGNQMLRLGYALKNAVSKKDMTVYRGLGSASTEHYKVGDVVEDKAHMSTSLSKEHVEESYANPEMHETPTILHLQVPKGTKAAYLDASGSGKSMGEVEVLLGRGTKYRINRIEHEGGRRVIHGEVVAPHEAATTNVLTNAYCPTGPGGGQDNSCSPTGSGSPSMQIETDALSRERLKEFKLTPSMAAEMAGALDGAKVLITAGMTKIKVEVDHPDYYSNTTILKNKVVLDEFYAGKPGSGVGIKAISKQIDAAIKAGKDSIELSAARADPIPEEDHKALVRAYGSENRVPREMVGYKVWPKFGWDADLNTEASFREGAIPPEGFTKVSQLMASQEGRDWWAHYGDTTHMSFDLSEGSYSRRVFDGYRKAKESQKSTRSATSNVGGRGRGAAGRDLGQDRRGSSWQEIAANIPPAEVWKEDEDLTINPAVSEAQRRYLNAMFGHDWVKEHHFDNKGKLPQYKDEDEDNETTDNAFCPTGPGGGVNPHCSPGGGGSGPTFGGLPVGYAVAGVFKGEKFHVEVTSSHIQVTDGSGQVTQHPNLTAAANFIYQKTTPGGTTKHNGWHFFKIPNPNKVAAVPKTAPATPPAPGVSHYSLGVPNAPQVEWETGKAQPGQVLHGVPFAAAPPKFWEKTKDVDVKEPPPLKTIDRVGIMVQEPDGRIWLAQPTNGFGDRKHTLPGGRVEKGLTNQQNALKEVWEETGLQVEITGHLGDFEDSNNHNNGRLYLGRRIGGAPWDAKPEPGKIPPSRKNGSTAESEAVTLATPDKAASLLHRTDDLAQLMAVHPPKLDTPTRGKGSEPLKKFVAGIAPASKKYADDMRKKHLETGNPELHAVQELRGFNGKPTMVSKKDMDALMSAGTHIEMLRGVKGASHVSAEKIAGEFKTGDHYPGYGCFGSGTYADAVKGGNNAANQYGSGGDIIRMALPKTARIVKQSELEKLVPSPPSNSTGYNGGHGNDQGWWGVQAAIAGYDAIHVDGGSSRHGVYGSLKSTWDKKDFYVVLNRSIVTVQKESAKGYSIP